MLYAKIEGKAVKIDMYSIVLIDDEPFTLEFLSVLVPWQEYGFTLSGKFEDAKEALDFIRENPPDLVISDIRMPDISGIEIAKFCYKHLKNTRVVLISAYRDFEYAKQAIKYSVLDYVEKPVKKKDIIEILKKYHPPIEKGDVNFPSDEEMSASQWLFSDLMCGIITDKNDLTSRLKSININPDIADHPCCLFTVHLDNFDNYLKNTWKHQKEQLYHAVCYIISEIHGGYTLFVVRHSYNNIEVIAISDSAENNNDTLSAMFEELKRELKTILGLDSEVISTAFSDNLSYYITNEPESKIGAFAHDNKTINKVYEFVEANYKRPISLDDVANYVNLSKAYFCIFYKKHTGETFLDTLNRYRIEQAKKILTENPDVKTSMMYTSVGFSNQGYFYKTFKQYTGKTPNEYLKNPSNN